MPVHSVQLLRACNRPGIIEEALIIPNCTFACFILSLTLSHASCFVQVGAEIVRKALSYPLRLIANNAGVNGSVVQQRVLENLDRGFGYNAATDKYEDLMQAGIIDPTKVRPLPEKMLRYRLRYVCCS